MKSVNVVGSLSVGLGLLLGAGGLSNQARAAERALAQAPASTTAAPSGSSAGTAGGGSGAALGITRATWWGHAAFVITTPAGATIAIDPWFDNPTAPKNVAPPTVLDAILITHGHSDHVGGAAQLAKKTAARVVAAYELSALIGAEHAEGMTPGGSIKIKDATIRLVEAVHGSGFGADPKTARYGGPAVGFVISVDNGPTIYHAGDTDVFSSMELIALRYRPTVALLPIGGHFTMDPAGAALAAKLLKVKTVVPMHFGTFPVLAGTPADLRAELKRQRVAGTKVLEMKPGDTTSFAAEKRQSTAAAD